MSRVYGARYAETAALDLPAVAKLIRADLKAARDDSGSPLFGLSFSVRTRNHHGRHYNAVHIDVDGLTDAEIHQGDGISRRPAVRADAVRGALDAVTGAYNWVNPECYDVRFTTAVTLLDDDERAYRASMKALKTSRT